MSLSLKMDDRICNNPRCNNRFRISENHNQEYCSYGCRVFLNLDSTDGKCYYRSVPGYLGSGENLQNQNGTISVEDH